MSGAAQTATVLSEAELATYARDGFVVQEAVFDEAELIHLREATERAVQCALEQTAGGRAYHLDGNRVVDVGALTVQFEHARDSDEVRVIEPVHCLDPRLDALVDDPRITGAMRELIGMGELSLWTTKLNLKRPCLGSGFGWHQDSPYWIHDCQHVDQLCNVFLNFDNATVANGCLRIIRGSHHKGRLPGMSNSTQLGGFFTDPSAFCAADMAAIEVPAGSLVFFSPHVVHGSEPNRSLAPRRAIILTYQPAGFPTLKSRELRKV